MNHWVKTTLLLVFLTGLMLIMGQAFGGKSGLTVTFVFALVMNVGSYWFSDSIVLKMHRAIPLVREQAPEIFEMTEEMAQKAGMPTPSLHFIPSASPNAFATGRDYKHGTVVLTKGLVELLNPEELKGVIGHEMAHIIHRDTLTSTIVATLSAVISYLAMMMRWSSLLGGYGGRSRGGVHPIVLLVVSILMPLAATMVQFAISREREYAADKKGAELCGQPDYLASALNKIASGVHRYPLHHVNPASAHLFIVNPLSGETFERLFSTHPPVEERVARLLRMGRF